MDTPARFRPVSFAEMPGWLHDGLGAAFSAFRRSAFRFIEKPYRTGALGIESGSFAQAYQCARESGELDDPSARAFFEREFAPVLVSPAARGDGFVTAFYEPVAEASSFRTPEFTVPLLARPDDLVDLDPTNRPATMDASFAFGRMTEHGVIPYFDRGEIERGVLAGRGVAIAWLRDKVDAFFIHVQGAARLNMTDGTERRVTYAAKTGHPFTGPGKVLADLGEIPLAQVTMQSIRAWFRANPERVDEILWRNRSYIFFRDAPVDDPALGPVAAAKVPLTPGRSLAVDRLLHTFGTPFYIDAPSLDAFGGTGFRRLMIAQDTGSAIVGPARGDLFAGSGAQAGEIAGVVKHPARFFMLVPRCIAERFT